MGTMDYMPPEQFTNTRGVDERADVYSLGCTLYRLLTNKRVFSCASVSEMFAAHQAAPIPSLRAARTDVSENLDAVFQKMLAKDPSDRQPSMNELIADLEGCLTSETQREPVFFDQSEDDFAFDDLFDQGLQEAPLSAGVHSEKRRRRRRKSRARRDRLIVGGISCIAVVAAFGLVVYGLVTHFGTAEPPHEETPDTTTGVGSARPSDNADRIAELRKRVLVEASSGRWKQAAAVCEDIIRQQPGNARNWLWAAVLSVHAQDQDRYRNLRRRMLSRFGKSERPFAALQIAIACSLTPWTEETRTSLAPLVKILPKDLSSRAPGAAIVATCLAAYRAGDHAAVIETAREILASPRRFYLKADAHLIRAMAHHELGQRRPATIAVRRAETILKAHTLDFDNNLWPEALISRILLREAKQRVRASQS